MKVLVAGIAVVLLTAGCAADKPVSPLDGGVAFSVVTQPPPEIRVPTGYELYDGTAEGFQLVLPTGWTAFGPQDLDYGEFFAGAEDEVDLEAWSRNWLPALIRVACSWPSTLRTASLNLSTTPTS